MTNLTEKLKSRLQTGEMTKTLVADKLGITRVTLDIRLERGNWKKSEIVLLTAILQ